MRLKHLLYITAIICAVAEIGMALYAMYWGDIIKEIAYAEHTVADSDVLVLKALNLALPVGVGCLALLLYTWRIDAIGGFGFFFAVVFHLIGYDLNVRAVKKVYGDQTEMHQVTWWIPGEGPSLVETAGAS
jgi:hypothetical protein